MPTKLQILLSYFYDVCLEKAHSPHHQYLEVVVSRGRIRLNTHHVTYSYEDLYANYYTVFKQINIAAHPLHRVLVLGFGLGSIPLMLNRHFAQSAHYTGIDIDPIILQLAQKYLPPILLSQTNLYCADAYTWVKQNIASATTYDLIAVDIFIDRNTPSPYYTTEFLTAVKSLLAPNSGLLIYNTLADTPDEKLKAKDFYDTVFKRTFDGAFCVSTPSNLMLVGGGSGDEIFDTIKQ